jgi:hypothetical protein
LCELDIPPGPTTGLSAISGQFSAKTQEHAMVSFVHGFLASPINHRTKAFGSDKISKLNI